MADARKKLAGWQEEIDDRLLRLELMLDRISVRTGQTAVLKGGTWEVSGQQIAQWTPNTILPLGNTGIYVRFKDGTLQFRGGTVYDAVLSGANGLYFTGAGNSEYPEAYVVLEAENYAETKRWDLVLDTRSTSNYATLAYNETPYWGMTPSGEVMVFNGGRYIMPTHAGVPTDSPSDGALLVDTANHTLYFRSGSEWRQVTGGGGIGGSGTDNYIPRWSGTDALENSVIYQDDGNKVGIGASTGLVGVLNVEKNTQGTYDNTKIAALLGDLDDVDSVFIIGNTINGCYNYDNDAGVLWLNYRGHNAGTTRFRDLSVGDGKGTSLLFVDGSEGRVGVKTNTPAYVLDINGLAYATGLNVGDGAATVLGSATLSTARWGGISTTGDATYPDAVFTISAKEYNDGDLAEFLLSQAHGYATIRFRPAGGSYKYPLYIDLTNSRVGINTSAPDQSLHVAGNFMVVEGDTSPCLAVNNTDYYWLNIQAGPNRATFTFEKGYAFSIREASSSLNYDSTPMTGTHHLLVASGGNVGIGELTPAARLTVMGGGVSIGTDANPGNNNLYVTGDCSAATFTDRTPWFEGSAVEAIRHIRGDRLHGIDHSTLPAQVRAVTIKREMKEAGGAEPTPIYEEYPEIGRNLSATVSMLLVAVQELTAKIESLEKEGTAAHG